MPLYRIPLCERSTHLDGAQFGCEKLMCVDGVGFFVHYLREQEHLLTPEYMRRFLMFRKGTHVIVRARRVEGAIKKFYSEWEGAKIGGDNSPESKALWINTQYQSIEELPRCERLRFGENSKGVFYAHCGGFGRGQSQLGCVLDGYTPPDECPITEFWDKMYDLRDADALPMVEVVGFNLVRAKDVVG